ncbi:MAG: redoxin domain-containing protein [Planctomycetales bacterium]|nr:redoxin domain-containing protein [Planctomycetales bacterium]
MKRWLQSAAALAVAGWMTIGAAMGADLKVGDSAPDFSLAGTDGKTYKLSELRGKHVVVAWFPKAFTGGCTKECNSLRTGKTDKAISITLLNGQKVELAASTGSGLDDFAVSFFTASCDTPETNQRYATELKLDYPILSDPSKKTAEAYGVVHEGREVPERWTFYIDPDGKILAIDKKVSTASHGGDIAAQLKKLGVPRKEK